MPPKNKGVKLTLHELNQGLGVDATQPFLPSQSSGIDERPERSDGDWRPDRISHGDRDDRRRDRDDLTNGAADGDFNWRAGAPARQSPRPRDPSSSVRRVADDEDFTRDAMPARSDMASRTASRGFESRAFDSGRPRDRGRGLTPSGWRRDSRSAGASSEEKVDWRATERVDTRPESLKNKYKQLPVTAAPTAAESEVKLPPVPLAEESSSEPTDAATSSKPASTLGAATSEIFLTPPKELSPEALKPISDSPPLKPRTAVDRACGLGIDSEPHRLSLEKASSTDPMINKTRPPTGDTSDSAAANAAPLVPYRPPPQRRLVISPLEDLMKKKAAEAEAAASSKPVSQPPADDQKTAYRKNLQEREQKRREEEEKRRFLQQAETMNQEAVMVQLMAGDPEQMKKLQDNIEAGLQSGVDGNALLSQFKSRLTDEDLRSLVPSLVVAKCLVIQSIETLRPMWDPASTATDKQRLGSIAALVKTLKPTLTFLFSKWNIRRYKLQFLLEIQWLSHAAGFPRVSEGLSLIEAIWDALYMEDVIQQQYFDWWYEATNDNTPGRHEVVFQMLGWFNWLQNALEEGQAEVVDNEDDDDEEDDF